FVTGDGGEVTGDGAKDGGEVAGDVIEPYRYWVSEPIE
ncbi:hypothetical protein A2U01_0089276, partial [Trifolium medium]|nr:hypothetical protein [Trifolium medium]